MPNRTAGGLVTLAVCRSVRTEHAGGDQHRRGWRCHVTATPANEAKTKKLSGLAAAAKVLAEAGVPLNCTQMIEAMTTQKYWTSPNGLTPQATLYAALACEVKTKGSASRFQIAERGHFALKH